MSELRRVLQPKSIALIGGLWARNVLAQLIKSNFEGEIWPINPRKKKMAKHKCFPDLNSLPDTPDVAFIAVNRFETIKTVKKLSDMNAGGAICFASGFSESQAVEHDFSGSNLQVELVQASGEMPIIGPNCYGLINYLDNISLWPDQHGGKQQKSGVAIIAQSSNVAINLTMQKRSVPISYVITVGNQAKTGLSKIVRELLDDPRVTGIGLYIEGFDDISEFQKTARLAFAKKIPIVAIKIGKTLASRATAITHTASISGNSLASSTFMKRLGVIEVQDLTSFLETLKFFHFFGYLDNNEIASVSCSGGEASLMADLSQNTTINFRDFRKNSKDKLSRILGPIVNISNPFDYHTFVWGDTKTMTRIFTIVLEDKYDLVVFLLDVPRSDRCDDSSFRCAINAIVAAVENTGRRAAVMASLPESMPEELATLFIDAGVVPLCGMETSLLAIQNAIVLGKLHKSNKQYTPILSNLTSRLMSESYEVLEESEGKLALSKAGVSIPRFVCSNSISELMDLVKFNKLKYPLVVKGQGESHKTERGMVILNVKKKSDLVRISKQMFSKTNNVLVEEMVTDRVLELCVSVVKDITGIFLLSIRQGGLHTELFEERADLLLPVKRNEILTELKTLKVAELLYGYRNTPTVEIEKLVSAIQAIANFSVKNASNIFELEVNPLIVGTKDSIAVDVLLTRKRRELK